MSPKPLTLDDAADWAKALLDEAGDVATSTCRTPPEPEAQGDGDPGDVELEQLEPISDEPQ